MPSADTEHDTRFNPFEPISAKDIIVGDNRRIVLNDPTVLEVVPFTVNSASRVGENSQELHSSLDRLPKSLTLPDFG